MKQWRIIRSIRRRLFVNKLRVILSLSGIAIGITCEIVTVGVGEGARLAVLDQINSMGGNLVTVAAGTFKVAFGRKMQTTFVTTLKQGDADAILAECPYVKAVAPAQQGMALVRYRNGSTSTSVIGTTPQFAEVKHYELSSGRFFNEEENRLSLRVAILGRKIVESLFRNADPVGEIIRIKGIPFKVIGTLKTKGVNYDGVNLDDEILIPLNTLLERVLNINYIGTIYVEASDKSAMGVVEREIRSLLRQRHSLDALSKPDDFVLQNVYTTMKVAEEANGAFRNLLGAVAALSLLVGGVGILAIMLLSVKERTSEIGLRMAVGAKSRDVLFQFFAEATSLSSAGGLAGILLGIAGVYLLRTLAGINAVVTFELVAASVLESVAIGILFGSLPARRASLVTPVTALRG